MATKKTTIEQIQEKYQLLPFGTRATFIKELAKTLGKSPITLRNHWFGNFWIIPNSEQPEVLLFMANWIDKTKQPAVFEQKKDNLIKELNNEQN